ncbi:MAG: DUF4988 and DUF4465 domain-containing protein [Prevotellaceae bacterium]|jgi:hypothetical protein|nr:DUF4988 and DUF4465 domain-containing protein [Prevotellaceae bacterium]
MKKHVTIIATILLIAGFTGCSKYDDSDLWNNVNNLEQRVKTLEDRVHQMNTEIDAIRAIVDALNAGSVITHITPTANGYTITFSGNREPITINHGNNGAPGTNAPVIGIREDAGVYYWTITANGSTDWLTDAQGQKLPVSGIAPIMGVDADGYWTVNGIQITGADGQPVKASGDSGDSFFSDVSDDEHAVTFTLANGVVIVIPKAENLTIALEIDNTLFFSYDETREYLITLSGVGSIIITKPDGWKASIKGATLSITAPPLANTFAEKDGEIAITVVGNNTTVNKTFTVSVRDFNHIIDFEEPGIEDYLAGPTAYGANLYDGHPQQYVGYYNAATELYMLINEDIWYGGYNFWSGGIAISRWNDMLTDGFINQCSVYYSDPATGNGGYNGSETFAVATGYNDPTGWSGQCSISFQDNTQECLFDHFYITNTTYAVLCMQQGGGSARAFSYANHDWFKLVIEGIGKNGNSTGTIDVYLADFRTADSPGIITKWTPVDLLPLGAVTEIKFDMQSSDTGVAGMNTPAYFCFDNLALKK